MVEAMITTDKNGREVEFGVAGDSDDVYISWMQFADTGEEADDETVEWVTENQPDALFEAWFERQGETAEYLADR